MKKKILGVFVSLLVIAMFALPMSSVIATKPETIEGTFTMLPTYPPPFPEVTIRPCGKSDMAMMTWDDLAMTVEGDMEGTGVYNGLWVTHAVPQFPFFEVRNAHGRYILDVEIGDLSGQLEIRINKGNMVIISGTGDLANLHGTGSLEGVSGSVYAYSINGHFDP